MKKFLAVPWKEIQPCNPKQRRASN
jgi:hypothetical protein